MKHLDLFSGYGGFTIPASKYGIETINFSEIDKYATAVLKYRFPSITNLGDITKIKSEDLPDVDLITGGSPCQDLSVAGKGAGLDGGRSGLFFCFIRLIKEKQPMYFVWENVKGALSSSKGWDFARVQIEMEQAGYDVWWQVINAKDFGVPQNRERIFAIGIRKGSGREILFERVGSSQDNKTQQQVSSTIHAGYYKQGGRDQQYIPNKIVNTGHEGTNIYGTDGITYTVDTGGTQGVQVIGNLYNSGGENGQVLDPRGISKTLKSGETNTKGNGGIGSSNSPKILDGAKTGLYAVVKNHGKLRDIGDTVTCIDSHYSQFPDNHGQRTGVIVHNLQPRSPNRPSLLKNKNAGGSGHLQREDGITYTVDTGGTQGVDLGDMRIRRLTPTECERLMGLEDGWTAKGIIDGKEVDISDTQRYKLCGNGVVVNCVDYIYNLITKSYER